MTLRRLRPDEVGAAVPPPVDPEVLAAAARIVEDVRARGAPSRLCARGPVPVGGRERGAGWWGAAHSAGLWPGLPREAALSGDRASGHRSIRHRGREVVIIYTRSCVDIKKSYSSYKLFIVLL